MPMQRAIRSLARTPGFALVAIATLGLALGAIGAVFAVVDAVLLKPLPYPGAERIARVLRVQGGCVECPVSRPVFEEWRAGSGDVFESMGAFTFAYATMTGDGTAEKLAANRVTPGFWDVMGVAPELGRTFDPADDASGRALVVISHALWQRRYGGDRGAIGRTVVLNGEAHEIIGVMPARFAYPDAAVWLPAELGASATTRESSYLAVLGRLRVGVTLDAADRRLATLTARQAQDFPANDAGLTARLIPLKTRLTSTVAPVLDLLFAAAAVVVLVACANLANLMLARAQARRRELAVRGALGASRSRLVGHLFGEALVIAAAGTALGIALARAAIALVPELAPGLLPAHNPLVLDATVLGFVAGVALLALLGFGVLPAWRHAARDPAAALQDEARGGTAGRARSGARAALVVAEVAMSLMLLAGAALLIESLRRIGEVDPAIDVEHVTVASLAFPPTVNVPGEAVGDYVERHVTATTPRIEAVLARVAALPGVERAALVDAVPLSGRGNTNSSVRVIGRDWPGGEAQRPSSEWRFVSADYFATVGLELLRGRTFTADEGKGVAEPDTVLVNAAFVRTFLADLPDPIGQQLAFMDDVPKTIVGVVESARQWGLAREPSPEVYVPVYDALQPDLELVIASALPAAELARSLPRALAEVAADTPVTDVRPMAAVVAEGETLRRFFATLMSAFGAVTLVLAMVGLYGVIAYSVQQRRAEFGVRLSLGASARDVLALVLRQGLALVATGLAGGLVATLLASRVLASLLYGVAPNDLRVLGAAALALIVTGASACVVPAWLAARTSPTEALRRG